MIIETLENCTAVPCLGNESDVDVDKLGLPWTGVEALFIFHLLNVLTQDEVPLVLICLGTLTNLSVSILLVRFSASMYSRASSVTSHSARRLSDLAGLHFVAACYCLQNLLLLSVIETYDWIQTKFSIDLRSNSLAHVWSCKLWQYANQVLRGMSSWSPLVLLWLHSRSERSASVEARRQLRVDGYGLARCLMAAMLVLFSMLNVHALWLYDVEDMSSSCTIFQGHHSFFVRAWPTVVHAVFNTLPTGLTLLVVVFRLVACVRLPWRRLTPTAVAKQQASMTEAPGLVRAARRLAWATVVQKVLLDLPCETVNAFAQVVSDERSDHSVIVTTSVIFVRLVTMLSYVLAPIVCLLCDQLYRFEVHVLCGSLCKKSRNFRLVAARERSVIAQLLLAEADADEAYSSCANIDKEAIPRHQTGGRSVCASDVDLVSRCETQTFERERKDEEDGQPGLGVNAKRQNLSTNSCIVAVIEHALQNSEILNQTNS